jgi:putative tryptophan/tyrosine transport system substrate-binding protein
MRRRDLIAILGCAPMGLFAEASGQEHARSYRLGILVQAPRNAAHWIAFFDEMRRNGYTQGKNLSVIDGFNTPMGQAAEIERRSSISSRMSS